MENDKARVMERVIGSIDKLHLPSLLETFATFEMYQNV